MTCGHPHSRGGTADHIPQRPAIEAGSTLRRVLIISPNFPPKSTADLHRVRTSLRHYARFGWQPTVLTMTPESSEGLNDAALADALPAGIDVRRVAAWDERRCRRFGFGHLAYRCLLPLYRAGCETLARDKYDVIFFSTTIFLCFVLGPLWKRRFGCRIVYDFQDPWYHGPLRPAGPTPGRAWKYRLDQMLARHLERFALKAADHVISVSDGYTQTLARRYPWLDDTDFTVVPFGAAEEDYEFVRRKGIAHGAFKADGGLTRWVSAGAVVAAMEPVLSVLFDVLAEVTHTDPRLAESLRVHFVGTNYGPAERASKRVEPLSAKYSLQEIVTEQPERIPYYQTLSLHGDSDALLLIGTSSPDYTPSKLLTCVLAKKPVMALCHRRSLMAKIAENLPNVFLATFDNSPADPDFRARIVKAIAWLRAPRFDVSAIEARLAPWSAKETTRIQCAIFDGICAAAPSATGSGDGAHARS